MATVMGGVGYGLYFTAKRYIAPLIQPPTPPQLEQDKASIDESFKRAFDLLEQLNTDTTALKASEEARTSRLDNALGEVESVLTSLKESSKRQGDDNRRIEDDVRGLRDLIPKAMDAQKESTDARLKELSTELKSLKTLVGNRMSAGPARPSAPTSSYYGQNQSQTPAATPNVNGTSGTSTPAPQASSTPAASEQNNVASTTEARQGRCLILRQSCRWTRCHPRMANGRAKEVRGSKEGHERERHGHRGHQFIESLSVYLHTIFIQTSSVLYIISYTFAPSIPMVSVF
jgi:peroxin-14